MLPQGCTSQELPGDSPGCGPERALSPADELCSSLEAVNGLHNSLLQICTAQSQRLAQLQAAAQRLKAEEQEGVRSTATTKSFRPPVLWRAESLPLMPVKDRPPAEAEAPSAPRASGAAAAAMAAQEECLAPGEGLEENVCIARSATIFAPLQLHAAWTGDASVELKIKSSKQIAQVVLASSAEGQPRAARSTSVMQRFVLAPTSPKRFVWDVLSAMAIAHDLVVLPLTAFNIKETQRMHLLALATSIFWVLDVFASFCQGYIRQGVIEMRPGRIARRYLQTWFAADIFLVVIDVGIYVLNGYKSNPLDALRCGKLVRVLRILRMARMVRVVKLDRMIEKLSFVLNIELLAVALDLLKLLGAVACCAHFLACSWYAAVYAVRQDGRSWLDHFDHEDDVAFLYVVSFHWVMAQVTPAPTPYHPVSGYELLFSILLILFGFAVFSFFLGRITTSITMAYNRARELRAHEMLIRHYLLDNQVSVALSHQISSFLAWRYRRKKRVLWADVPALKTLPRRVHMQLRYEVCSPVLTLHPMLLQLKHCYHEALVGICVSSTREACWSRGDELFCFGARAAGMTLVISGSLRYCPGALVQKTGEQVGRGQFLSEVALWCPWLHRGSLTAADYCETMELSAESFGTVLDDHQEAKRRCVCYAAEWLKRLADLTEDASDISRLSAEDLQELACAVFEEGPTQSQASGPRGFLQRAFSRRSGEGGARA